MCYPTNFEWIFSNVTGKSVLPLVQVLSSGAFIDVREEDQHNISKVCKISCMPKKVHVISIDIRANIISRR